MSRRKVHVNSLIAGSRIAATRPLIASEAEVVANATEHEQRKECQSVDSLAVADEPDDQNEQFWRMPQKHEWSSSLMGRDGASKAAPNVHDFVSTDRSGSDGPLAPRKPKKSEGTSPNVVSSSFRSRTSRRWRSADGRVIVQPFSFAWRQSKPRRSRTLDEYKAQLAEKQRQEDAVVHRGKVQLRKSLETAAFYNELVGRRRARSAEFCEKPKQHVLSEVERFSFDCRDGSRSRSSERCLCVRQRNCGIFNRPTFRPIVHTSVPDFDDEFRRFLQSAQLLRSAIQPTRCRPFALHADARTRERAALKQIDKRAKEILEQETLQRVTKQPGNLHAFYQDDIPAILFNKTVELRLCKRRQEAACASKVKQAESRFHKAEQLRHHRIRQALLSQTELSRSCNASQDPLLRKSRQLQREQLENERQYQQQLRKMRERLNERPSLAEQERRLAAANYFGKFGKAK